ncbi:HAD-IA family hydrolase [Citreimonas sp.]|uniref:HAD-IA family hydrolase n=1 Tax=Citreimonas sp. TaxID=3036715 RepID=UPI0040595B07
MRCVIFDLDGTLADTSGDLVAAANACFEGMGIDSRLDAATDAAIALRGGRPMLTEGLARAGRIEAETVEAWYPRLLQFYGEALDVHTRMYPGAVETIEGLRSAGYAVGVCTNKPFGLAQTLLTSLGVRDLFGSLIGADTLPVRKPDPAPFWAAVDGAGGGRGTALLVGDTDTDRKTATAAGVPCVLVGFVEGTGAMHALKPEAVIERYEELPPEVTRLIG